MKKPSLLPCAILFLFAVVWTHSPELSAEMIYEYRGNNFDTFLDEDPPPGSYTNRMFVSGTFTILNTLAPSLPWTNISSDVLEFSFSDGRNTFTNLNSLFSVVLATDSAGTISQWSILARRPLPSMGLGDNEQQFSVKTDNNSSSVLDIGTWSWALSDQVEFPTIDSGSVSNNPGTWNAVPIPSTMLLFGSGMIGLCALRRKSRKYSQEIL